MEGERYTIYPRHIHRHPNAPDSVVTLFGLLFEHVRSKVIENRTLFDNMKKPCACLGRLLIHTTKLKLCCNSSS